MPGLSPARLAVLSNALRAASVPAPVRQSNLVAGDAAIADGAAGFAAAGADVRPVTPVASAVYGDGTQVGAVGRLSLWQMKNGNIDTVARLGLPLAAFFAYRAGHGGVALALVGGGGLLWANRLTGLNL